MKKWFDENQIQQLSRGSRLTKPNQFPNTHNNHGYHFENFKGNFPDNLVYKFFNVDFELNYNKSLGNNNINTQRKEKICFLKKLKSVKLEFSLMNS